MRSNRLRGCLVVAALFAGTSSASARDNTDEKTDENSDGKTTDNASASTDENAATKAAPRQVAQATEPQAGPSPTEPAQPPPAPPLTEEQVRKMVDEQVAKGTKYHGPTLEFNGYGRAGVGLAVRGGKQVCFGLAGADTKWRLGNECDYVIEPQFTGRLVENADKSDWGVVVMPGLYRTWDDPNGPDKTFFNDVPTVFRQFYFFGENLPQLLNGRVWGGRRYYDRLHLDINDQFLEIEDGDGAGIEEMHVGPGKLSVAFLMNPNSEAAQVATPATPSTPSRVISTANLAPYKLTARFTDIPTMPDANIQIWAALYGTSTSPDQAPADNGVTITAPDTVARLGVYHTITKLLGGMNLIGAKVEYGPDHLLLRGVVDEVMRFNESRTGVDVIGEFRTARNRTDSSSPWVTNSWASLGGRFDTELSGPFRLMLDAGIDHVFAATGGDPNLVKTTACLAMNAGIIPDARPTIRLFYTQAFWNDAAKSSLLGVYNPGAQSGTRLAQVYGNANTGGSFGIQTEAWW